MKCKVGNELNEGDNFMRNKWPDDVSALLKRTVLWQRKVEKEREREKGGEGREELHR